jgi:molybdopterin-biosynthesis enzyme MoeA-like protein
MEIAAGSDLKELQVVASEGRAIADALDALRHRYTYVFTTGGIGPTQDDITADCAAKAFGVPRDADPRALDDHRVGGGAGQQTGPRRGRSEQLR